MKKTLGSLQTGAKFKFGGVKFIKGVANTISEDEAFTCQIEGQDAYVSITSAAMVSIKVKTRKSFGLYAQIPLIVAVRPVNGQKVKDIILDNGGKIIKEVERKSSEYHGFHFKFTADAIEAAKITEAINTIEEEAAKQGHGFNS